MYKIMVNKSQVTIRDVAKVAGVSTQTVSRVLNNRPDVSPSTRKRVQNVIADLGYAPNTVARSLSRGSTNTLGIVGFGLEYFGSSRVLNGIERKANELGYSITLTLFDQFTGGDADTILVQLAAQQVAGIIWSIPGFTDSPDLDRPAIQNSPIPIVHLNRKPSQKALVVSINNRLGGRIATEHLFQQGAKKVGIITGPHNWWESEERLAGWKEVMNEKGISKIDDLIFEGNWEAESGNRGFQALIAKNNDLDAIFVSNDQMALGVIQASHHLGIRIPDELRIVGFDDIPESGYFIPSLTTMQQNLNQLGALAVLRLQACIQDPDCLEGAIASNNLIAPELIVRESSTALRDYAPQTT